MRATWILGLALGLSCGKELNPDYCIHHLNDPQCQTAGLATVDAPANCAITGCMGAVCDTMSGTCVECTPADPTACTSQNEVCSHDEHCVGCTSGSNCPSGVCLPDQSCAAPGTILYATPGGSTDSTNDCTNKATACSLKNAVAHALPTRNVIQLAGGAAYSEGTITLGVPGLELIVEPGMPVTITNPGGDVFDVTASASIAQMTIDRAGNDGIKCSESATLTLDQMVISNSGNDAVSSDGCVLTITRSKLIFSQASGLDVSNTTLTAINNFIYGNGNSTLFAAAVYLTNHTKGQVRFNTIGFNTAADPFKNPYPAGMSCDITIGGNDVNFSDNLVSGNEPEDYDNGLLACGSEPSGSNWIGAPTIVNFVSTASGTMDLHLTANTPVPKTNGQGPDVKGVRDNPITDCTDVKIDFDDDVRPQNQSCDYGADEFSQPGSM